MVTTGGRPSLVDFMRLQTDIFRRFCQIRYFHEKVISGKKQKLFHGLWFVHGSKTILQEVSHSKALYMLETCDDNAVSTIFKKCHVQFMRPGDEEAVDDGSRDSNDFHCSFVFS